MLGPLAVERRISNWSTSPSMSSSRTLEPSKLLASCTEGQPPCTIVAMPALSTLASRSGLRMPLCQTGNSTVSASATCWNTYARFFDARTGSPCGLVPTLAQGSTTPMLWR